MNQHHDDWDADEHDALAELQSELSEIRLRHADDPSLAMLRAADADALPPELQARVDRHLQDSAWSRALVEGLRETGTDIQLDAATEQRLFERITRETKTSSSKRRWSPAMTYGGLAIAATILVAVLISRSRSDRSLAPGGSSAGKGDRASIGKTEPTPSAAPLLLAYNKPDIKLSLAALTWRGNQPTSPFLQNLAPAFESYRAGDYPRAVAEFNRLSTVYPEAIEVLFYQGVSRMLAGDDAGAIAPLESAARLGNATFADDVSWFLAVAMQRAGRPEARERLVNLCGGSGPHVAAACEAVKQLSAAPSSPR